MAKGISSVIWACMLSLAAHAACQLPPAPTKIPDGATASDEEIRATMIAMSHYETDVSSYVKCLAFEVTQGRLSKEAEARLSNAALSSHQAIITRFNAQMKLYMAR